MRVRVLWWDRGALYVGGSKTGSCEGAFGFSYVITSIFAYVSQSTTAAKGDTVRVLAQVAEASDVWLLVHPHGRLSARYGAATQHAAREVHACGGGEPKGGLCQL